MTQPYCPICQSQHSDLLCRVPDVEHHTSKDLYDYFECKDCLGVYIHPQPLAALSQIYPSNYYANHAGDGDSLFTKVKEFLDKRLFKSVCGELDGESLNALDIGGGSGWMLNLLKRVEPRVDYTAVVDLNSSSEPLAVKSGHKFFCTRIEDFHTDKQFDVIIMLNLIEHVSEPAAVLEKMQQLLTPQGKLIIKTPNTDTLDRRMFINRYWGGLHAPRHWVLFNRDNFESLAKRQGLKIIRFSYTQGAPQWTTSILGSAYLNGHIQSSEQRALTQHPMTILLLILSAGFDLIRSPFFKTAQFFAVLQKQE